MNINNDYQKRRGQTTSSPTGEIIEPNKKYLESNSFSTIKFNLQGILGETQES